MPCPMSRGREKGNGCGIRRRGNQPGFHANTGGDIGAETRLEPHEGRLFVGMTVGESTRHAPRRGWIPAGDLCMGGYGFPHAGKGLQTVGDGEGMGPRIREDNGGGGSDASSPCRYRKNRRRLW